MSNCNLEPDELSKARASAIGIDNIYKCDIFDNYLQGLKFFDNY